MKNLAALTAGSRGRRLAACTSLGSRARHAGPPRRQDRHRETPRANSPARAASPTPGVPLRLTDRSHHGHDPAVPGCRKSTSCTRFKRSVRPGRHQASAGTSTPGLKSVKTSQYVLPRRSPYGDGATSTGTFAGATGTGMAVVVSSGDDPKLSDGTCNTSRDRPAVRDDGSRHLRGDYQADGQAVARSPLQSTGLSLSATSASPGPSSTHPAFGRPRRKPVRPAK